MKILILKPSSLGDIIQALPVLRLLKRHLPHSEVYWWIDTSLAPLLEGDPDLAGVIRFERKRWISPWHWDEVWHSIRELRAHRFDWVIDLQSLARSGAVAWLANGRFTIGLDDAREGARGFYDTAVRRPSAQAHAVEWYLEVLRKLDVPVTAGFSWIPVRPEVAAMVRRKWPGDGARWLIVNPGARWENKVWPVEYFAEAVRQISARIADVKFAILGSHAERSLGRTIAAAHPERCLDLTGRTSLLEMVEWIRRAELMVTNDTGPMHVAAALGKPVIALFGPTHPRRTGPYGAGHTVLQHLLPCAPCMKDYCAASLPLECLRALVPARVVQAVESRLHPFPTGGAPEPGGR